MNFKTISLLILTSLLGRLSLAAGIGNYSPLICERDLSGIEELAYYRLRDASGVDRSHSSYDWENCSLRKRTIKNGYYCAAVRHNQEWRNVIVNFKNNTVALTLPNYPESGYKDDINCISILRLQTVDNSQICIPVVSTSAPPWNYAWIATDLTNHKSKGTPFKTLDECTDSLKNKNTGFTEPFEKVLRPFTALYYNTSYSSVVGLPVGYKEVFTYYVPEREESFVTERELEVYLDSPESKGCRENENGKLWCANQKVKIPKGHRVELMNQSAEFFRPRWGGMWDKRMSQKARLLKVPGFEMKDELGTIRDVGFILVDK